MFVYLSIYSCVYLSPHNYGRKSWMNIWSWSCQDAGAIARPFATFWRVATPSWPRCCLHGLTKNENESDEWPQTLWNLYMHKWYPIIFNGSGNWRRCTPRCLYGSCLMRSWMCVNMGWEGGWATHLVAAAAFVVPVLSPGSVCVALGPFVLALVVRSSAFCAMCSFLVSDGFFSPG